MRVITMCTKITSDWRWDCCNNTHQLSVHYKPIRLAIGRCNNAGSSGSTATCELALPAGQGGHQSHLAAALAAQQQHCNQQKQLHAALQTDLTAIGKPNRPHVSLVPADGISHLTLHADINLMHCTSRHDQHCCHSLPCCALHSM